MADAQLNILIKARNDAKKEFDSLNKQINALQGKGSTSGISGLSSKFKEVSSKFKEVTGLSLGFASAAGLAGFAIQKTIAFTKEAIAVTVAHQTAVDEMSRLIGENVEQTSRLIEASDDLFISQEQLTTAMQAASRKGIDTSITGIKKLSEQYLKLNPGVERAKFLMDNFGRSGAAMGKLMEIGATGIDTAMAAISDSLIVTEESRLATIEYKQSIDALGDAFAGIQYQVGTAVMPVLSDLNIILASLFDDVTVTKTGFERFLDVIVAIGTDGTVISITDMLSDWADGLRNTASGLEDVCYYTPLTKTAIIDLGESIVPVTTYFQELTKQLIFNIAAAGLTSEQQLILAENMGLVDEATLAAITEIQKIREEFSQTGDIETFNGKIVHVSDSIEKLKSKTITITTIFKTEGHPPGASGGGGTIHLGVDEEAGGMPHATGGPVSSGKAYLVGEQGPELYVPNAGGMIIPNNKLAGGGQTINIYYSTALSLTDRTEVMTKLRPLIQEALRA